MTMTKRPTLADLAEVALLGPGIAIPMQEKRGQQELVSSTRLPVQGSESPEAQASPIQWGDVVKDDPLFREATLPAGWKKVAADHDMWSFIKDDKGRTRAKVFYKAAFYDRRASIDFCRRYTCEVDYRDEAYAKVDVETTAMAMDYGVVPPAPVHKSTRQVPNQKNNSQAHYAAVEENRKAVEAWLKEKFPNHADPNAYWDEPATRYDQILENEDASV